ncbi:MAG: hypothetical protein COB92_03985 [Robiginitomaculum sp.]|nr:MAG: hypothetical protein COB92_03985 [Robiginitomaculum sp.]
MRTNVMQTMVVCAFRTMMVAASITGALSNVAVAQENGEPAAKETQEHKMDKRSRAKKSTYFVSSVI